jgi:hypothetical protein
MSGYIAATGTAGEYGIVKHFERSGVIEVVCWYLTGGTVENHGNPQPGEPVPRRVSK